MLLFRDIDLLRKKHAAKLSQLLAKRKKQWTDNSSTKRVVLLTESLRISQSQIFPFYYFYKSLINQYGLELIEIELDRFDKDNMRHIVESAEIIIFQPWFSRGESWIVDFLKWLRATNKNSQILFLDAYAPLDIRFANAVDEYIDFYCKKSIFKDLSRYQEIYNGDDHLVEFYNELYDIEKQPQVDFRVSESFLNKLHVSPGFFTSELMLPMIDKTPMANFHNKKYDVHARLAAAGTPWYQKMREAALLACEPFKDTSVITSDKVGSKAYWKELFMSRICLSPYGYGETCWRDYEAIVAGSLLVKPDMSHVKQDPNIFIPFETYIPVKWDFSDVSEKLAYYLSHNEERIKIAENAYEVLHQYVKSESFSNQFNFILGR